MILPITNYIMTYMICNTWKLLGLCFVSTLNVNGHKFDPQAHSCTFLRTSSFKKGYEALNLSTSQILISKDVVFHEHIFPSLFLNSLMSFLLEFIFLQPPILTLILTLLKIIPPILLLSILSFHKLLLCHMILILQTP